MVKQEIITKTKDNSFPLTNILKGLEKYNPNIIIGNIKNPILEVLI